AAEKGHEGIVKLLLDTGKAEFDSKGWNGQTLLSWAASSGNKEVVKLLLETSKVHVGSKDITNGRTQLLWAAEKGHEVGARRRLSCWGEAGKLDADSKDEYGRVPLSQVAANRQQAVVKPLFDTGKVEVNFKDKAGRTPLSWVAPRGHEVVVNLLQSHINLSG
ncbi:ankyrin, partial [Lindgomyces ingoldianus]